MGGKTSHSGTEFGKKVFGAPAYWGGEEEHGYSGVQIGTMEAERTKGGGLSKGGDVWRKRDTQIKGILTVRETSSSGGKR